MERTPNRDWVDLEAIVANEAVLYDAVVALRSHTAVVGVAVRRLDRRDTGVRRRVLLHIKVELVLKHQVEPELSTRIESTLADSREN